MVVVGALTGLTLKMFSLQMAAVWFGMVGFGFTVTVTVNGLPRQLPAAPETGVTV